jgi:hypothetical protein
MLKESEYHNLSTNICGRLLIATDGDYEKLEASVFLFTN